MSGKSGTGVVPSFGDARPELWVVGDGSRISWIDAAEACGFRVSRWLAVADALAAIAERHRIPLIVVEAGDTVSDEAAAMLDLLDAQAQDSRTAVIVSCQPDTLDEVAARVAAPYAAILCDPTPTDRVMAIYAATPSLSGVAAADHGADTQRLLRLTEEVARIARSIVGLADESPGSTSLVSDGLTGYRGPPSSGVSMPVAASDIRTIIRWRRRREALFSASLFADPAWDMMLDLAAARIEGAEVAISSLCIAAAVPATTALRWIKSLTDAGVFVRVDDPDDRRRVYIRMADGVAATVLNFLAEAKGASSLLV